MESKKDEAAIEETAGGTAESKAAGKAAASPKKHRRRWPIAVGVVVVVAAVAGAGFWTWHEQPSFCNAICHSPMDPYLPTYEATPGQAATDKWGNTVDDASCMLAPVHRVDADATCLSCHTPEIGEQITEGMEWVSGGYELTANATYGGVLSERTTSQLTAARGTEADSFCLNESCHNITRDDLVEMTSDRTRNPHSMRHGEVACTTCHKAHRASTLYCTECHADSYADLPEGWVPYDESQAELEKTA